jgi:hypothetical protein
MKSYSVLKVFGWLVGLALLLAFFEAASAYPHYELEPAIVRRVVPDSRGFIGADEMTLIRFDDGYDTEIAGNRGAPGDRILAPRYRGVDTIFGWFSHRKS